MENVKQTHFTLGELLSKWLARYPHDIDHPDLEQMAIAGYVETRDGTYIWYQYWDL